MGNLGVDGIGSLSKRQRVLFRNFEVNIERRIIKKSLKELFLNFYNKPLGAII